MMFKKSRSAGRPDAFAFAIVLIAASLSANADIFVTNDGSYTVTVYANSAAGDQTPLRELDVAEQPRGIDVDTGNSEIFVATQGGSIFVYDINASGATAPKRTITSSGDFQGIHVDTANNEIFVADRDGFIHVYSRTATGGGAPSRSLTINAEPRGVSVNAGAGELYVTIPDEVLTFARTASGVTAPLRTITSTLGDMSQITFDPAKAELVVANHGSDAIRVWPRTADGAASPTRSIIGLNTLLDSPRGVAVCSGTGEYLATARNDDLITVYAAGANDNVAPLRTIGGSATQLDSPRFIAVTGTGCSTAPIISAAIPVLGPQGLLALAALLGFLGIRFARRRPS